MEVTTNLLAALELAAKGYYVFPMYFEKNEKGEWKKKYHVRWKYGKYDQLDEFIEARDIDLRDCRASVDPILISEWWRKWPDASIGIACGPSGVIGFDIDGEEGRNSFANSELELGEFPKKVIAQARRGPHYYVRAGKYEAKNKAGTVFGPGVDVRGFNGMMVAPPTVHPDGAQYRWATDFEQELLPKLPKAWKKRLEENSSRPVDENGYEITFDSVKTENVSDPAAYLESVIAGEEENIRSAPEGRRNDILNLAGLRVGHYSDNRGFEWDEVRHRLVDAYVKAHGRKPGADSVRDIIATLESGYTDGRKELIVLKKGSKEFPAREWNDVGNAKRILDRYEDRVRYIVDDEKWAVYEKSGLWVVGVSAAKIKGLARSMVERAETEEAPNYSSKEIMEGKKTTWLQEWRKWINQQKSAKHFNDAVSVLMGRGPIQVLARDFNEDGNVMHTTDGVLNLLTGEVMEHSPKFHLSRTTKVAYVPGARDKLLDDYFDRFLPNEELRRFYQRVFGYSLLDGNPERIFVFVKGPTSSGKSTFNEMVLGVLGDYGSQFSMSVMRGNQDDKPRTDVLAVINTRYTATVEASSEWRWHADQIKRMSGMDKISARGMHGKVMVTKLPSFTPFTFTNEIPSINGRDVALDRRILVLPFDNTITKESDNPRVAMELRNSKSAKEAMFAWLVEGLQEYLKHGFGEVPEECLVAKEAAVAEFSNIDGWLYNATKDLRGSGEEYFSSMDDLHDSITNYFYSNGIDEKIDKVHLGRALEARGYLSGRPRIDGRKTSVRYGISIKKRWLR